MKQEKANDGQEPLLSSKEEAFCQHVFQGLKQSEAYIKAGYKTANPNIASACANRLLKRDQVQKRLAFLRKEMAEKYNLTADAIYRRLGAIVNTSMGDIGSWRNGTFTAKNSADLPDAYKLAIEEISETVTKDGGSFKIKLISPVAAARLGAELLKLVGQKDVGEDPIAKALDRIANRI